MKTAIVHELLTMRGGAERTAKILADLFPDAPIYTLLYDEKKLGEWFPAKRVRTSSLQKYAKFSTNHHLYLSRFPGAVEKWDFSEFDLVISSSSAFAHGIVTNGKPKHLSYIHSPARYLWDRTIDVQEQAGKGLIGPIRKWHLSKLFHKLRIWDCEASYRPDMLLAASVEVQRRIELYWRKPSTVLYPPIDDIWLQPDTIAKTTQFHEAMTEEACAITTDDNRGVSTAARHERRVSTTYYLIVSTLARYKRIDLAIEACNRLKKRLLIVGEGPDKKRLQKLAGPTITFLGYLPHEEVRNLYENAQATLFPGEEDFGLVPLESMACGTPVIAYAKGGALETVSENTGTFFSEALPQSLIDAMKIAEGKTYDKELLRNYAAMFSRQKFVEGIEKAIERLMQM